MQMRWALPLSTFLFLASCGADDKPVNTDSTPVTMDSSFAHRSDSANADSSGNPHYDCSVLRKKIPAMKDDAQIQADLADLAHCGVDSFDILYVVPNLFPGYVNEHQVQGDFTITYADFLKHMEEFRSTPAYTQLHERVNTLDSLKRTPFDQRKVYATKATLGKLGFTEPEWEMFKGFANTYPVPKNKKFTWGDMLDEFEKYNTKNQPQ